MCALGSLVQSQSVAASTKSVEKEEEEEEDEASVETR